ERERRSAPAPGVERYEMGADIDVDVAHAGIGHGATRLVIGDQQLHDLALAAAGIEVDGLAGCMLGDAAGAGNPRPGAAGGEDLHGAELRLDAVEQLARRGLEAFAQANRPAVWARRAGGVLCGRGY